MPLEEVVGAFIVGALALYAVTGGADFGGGVWDLLASGPRARGQRETIARALAPIWEANHVWLIAAIVLLFTGFPAAFAALCTALHVPLLFMLLGVVARGSAFIFRSHGRALAGAWGRVFAVASLMTPLALGVCAGAAASGAPREWLSAFALSIGAFALSLFSFLAATYLCLETDAPALREDFRTRALVSGAACGALAGLCLALAENGAPIIAARLARSSWAWAFHLITAACAIGALAALWRRRYGAARLLAAAQVNLVVAGWGLAQWPYILYPSLTLAQAAAPASVLRPLVWTAAAGAAVVIPSFLWLFRIFKLR